MGQTKFAQRAKAGDGFGQLGSAEFGPKNEPQGRGEHKTVGNWFWTARGGARFVECGFIAAASSVHLFEETSFLNNRALKVPEARRILVSF
ncbi:hypothetical protein [Methylocaldum sp. GT1TLB]|uniref:hypothetical protein n=1 Tax=Methylocaldum sp. GT1TLB TaxID=3438965 RepID=UPI003DA00CE6